MRTVNKDVYADGLRGVPPRSRPRLPSRLRAPAPPRAGVPTGLRALAAPAPVVPLVVPIIIVVPSHIVDRRDENGRLRRPRTDRVACVLTSGARADVLRRTALRHLVERLSRREAETCRYLLTGLSEKQIARAMGIALNTAHVYIKSVYRQFEACSRAEFMAMWIRR